MESQKNNQLPLALVISAILISASVFYLAYSLNNKNTNNLNIAQNTPTVNAEPNDNKQPQAPSIQKVKVDDDAVDGKKDAPVTIVEFSDFECPFCKRHFQNVYPDLKKNYVDTGKVKIIFRDLPLSFHEPMASKLGVVANCAREQGGDTAYYKLHNAIFTQTAGNGTGITDANIEKIITEAGLNLATFKTCNADADGKQKAEVAADATYGNSIGANGTPTFFIGKSTTTGEIDGEILIGAQPYDMFKSTIEKYLK